MPQISLVTASFVTREVGYAGISEWMVGDAATQQHFKDSDSFAERFDQLMSEIQQLGYSTIDLWGAHLHYRWATTEHYEAARASLASRGIRVNSLAAWCHSLESLEGFCRVANEVGADIIAGGSPTLTEQRPEAEAILAGSGVRFAIENHPEKHPDEVLSVIGDSEVIGSCPDSGWWAIQGFHPPEAIRRLADRILTVHLKDVDGATHKGRRPGDGIADIDGCLEALASIGYEGAVGVEHEPDGWDPSDDLAFAHQMLSDWTATL